MTASQEARTHYWPSTPSWAGVFERGADAMIGPEYDALESPIPGVTERHIAAQVPLREMGVYGPDDSDFLIDVIPTANCSRSPASYLEVGAEV